MNFCTNCGKQLDEDHLAVCPYCGYSTLNKQKYLEANQHAKIIKNIIKNPEDALFKRIKTVNEGYTVDIILIVVLLFIFFFLKRSSLFVLFKMVLYIFILTAIIFFIVMISDKRKINKSSQYVTIGIIDNIGIDEMEDYNLDGEVTFSQITGHVSISYIAPLWNENSYYNEEVFTSVREKNRFDLANGTGCYIERHIAYDSKNYEFELQDMYRREGIFSGAYVLIIADSEHSADPYTGNEYFRYFTEQELKDFEIPMLFEGDEFITYKNFCIRDLIPSKNIKMALEQNVHEAVATGEMKICDKCERAYDSMYPYCPHCDNQYWTWGKT